MASTRMTDDYAQPQPISDAQLAFPASLGSLLPPTAVIPDDYPYRDDWLDFQRDWFYGQLPEDCEMHPAPGIDAHIAGRHLEALQRSFQPKHEHKEVAVAWLSSRWFTHVTSASDDTYYIGDPDASTG